MEYLSILNAAALVPLQEENWGDEVPASLRRRDPRIWQMAYCAAQRTVASCPVKPQSIVIGTALGALDETKNFLDGVFTDGLGSPRNFIASVHNSMAGKLALELKIHGPNLTLCDGHNSLASALGACALLCDKDFPVLVVAVDENIELLNRIIPHLSRECSESLNQSTREGAVAFLLHNKIDNPGPRLRSKGPLFLGNRSPDEACTTLAASQKPDIQASVVVPSQTAGSFLNVPLCIFDIFRSRQTGHFSIGSFSPSSRSMALVELCQ
jgi:hypothetical protein